MLGWLVGVVGIVFLAVMFDIIYPNGKTSAFCKSIFGLFAVFIMISPILNLNVDFDFSQDSIDTSLVYNINKAKQNTCELTILTKLENAGIVGIDVEIDSNLYNSDFVINNVFVDTTNIVLTENITNINKYEVITSEVMKIVDIGIERIICYG